jgi:hypothetical protein
MTDDTTTATAINEEQTAESTAEEAPKRVPSKRVMRCDCMTF